MLSETDRAAKPSVILSAPNVELTDEQTEEIARVTQQRCLEDDPLRRRRYALIIHAKYAFIIGGYDFDRKSKTRSQPQQDFVYEIVRSRREAMRVLFAACFRRRRLTEPFRLSRHLVV